MSLKLREEKTFYTVYQFERNICYNRNRDTQDNLHLHTHIDL